jgi:PCFT/HCP family folate transporter-like MFS transporter 1/3
MFVKIWKLSDSLIGLLSCFGFVIANVMVAFAPRGHEYGWIMYLAAVIQMFGGMTTIVIRSMISKIVPKQELAKVFTFVACGEAAVPIIANALYSLIFIESEKSFAGAFSLLSAGINFWVLCHFIYFFISTRQNPEILELEEEEPDAVIN